MADEGMGAGGGAVERDGLLVGRARVFLPSQLRVGLAQDGQERPLTRIVRGELLQGLDGLGGVGTAGQHHGLHEAPFAFGGVPGQGRRLLEELGPSGGGVTAER